GPPRRERARRRTGHTPAEASQCSPWREAAAAHGDRGGDAVPHGRLTLTGLSAIGAAPRTTRAGHRPSNRPPAAGRDSPGLPAPRGHSPQDPPAERGATSPIVSVPHRHIDPGPPVSPASHGPSLRGDHSTASVPGAWLPARLA